MLKPNLLALAVASVLASGAVYAADTDSGAAGYLQKSAPAQPDGTSNAADQATTPGGDQPAAKATDDSTVNLGEIKVTGVRAAIEEAISVKQNSNEIVEAISAEDIGKLPDNSIAESLARLPGITAQRVNGRASLISIRGFSGDFNGTLLNGREQVSTGDNRAVEFDQYPSEIMAGVVVYKTPDASLVGQGISGTVDLQTVRPLDFSQRTISVSARGETNSNGSVNPNTDSEGYRIAAAYIDQYNDHTLGLSIAYARLKSPVQDDRWEPWGYTQTSTTGDAYVVGGGKVYADSVEGTRDSVMTTLEYRPNDQWASVLDLYYSKFNQDTTYRGFEACLAYCGAPSDPTYTGNVVTGATFNNVKPVLRDELDAHNDKIYEVGWNNKFHFADHWTATADLSYGKATSSQSFLEEYAGTVPGSPGATDTWGVTVDPVTGVPTFSPGLNYNDTNIIKLVDSGGWSQDGYLKYPKVTDEMKVVRADVSRDLNSFVSKVDFGINYNDRTKTRNSEEWLLFLKSSSTPRQADIPANCIEPSSVDLGYVGFGPTVSWDLNCVLPLYNQVTKYNQDITNKHWKVEEKITTGYLKFDIDTDVAGLPLRGNIGGQYIYSDQNSDAFAVGAQDAQNKVSAVSGGTNYNDFLPDMNLALTLPYEQIMRFSAGKQIARPRMDDMRASTEYNLSAGHNPAGDASTTTCTNPAQPSQGSEPCYWSGSGGNPQLKPFKANAYDLTWEKYWETKAYVAAAFWYKDLNTYIFTQNLPKDYAGLPDPTSGALVPASTIGSYSQPANGNGGYMRGYELTASLPLEILIAQAEGFGFYASYSDTDSSIHPNGKSQPFPGLSKYVLNATFYYEKNGFSARIAERHRSDFLGEVQGFGADQSFVDIKSETITDLQLSYTFADGDFKGLTVLFQVNNLTNEPYRQTVSVGNGQVLPQQYTDYGRQMLLGATYKF